MNTERPKLAPVLSLPKSKREGKQAPPETATEEMERTIRQNVAASSLANASDPPAPQAPPQHTLPTIQTTEPPSMSTQDSSEQTKPKRQIHSVKLESEYFEDYAKKRLNAQTRLNDRNYQPSDILIQKEYDPFLHVHTGRELISVITNIRQTPGLQPGYVLMHTKALT